LDALPTTWHHDVLRRLDYLRGAGIARDDRADKAVVLMAKRLHQNGRRPLHLLYPEDSLVEAGADTASRRNTLRAMRVRDS
jgi:hypothetical protein